MNIWCSQCALVITSSVFALAGLVLFIFGCLLKFGSGYIEDYIVDILSGSSTFIKSTESEGNRITVNLEVYLSTGAYILTGGGACFLVVSFFGCCGSLKKIKCFLIFFAAVVVFLILAEVTVIVAVAAFPEKVANVIRDFLYTSLRKDYRGIHSSDAVSVIWNYVMVMFQCCGVVNSDDFRSADQWVKKVTLAEQPINRGLTTSISPVSLLLTTPIACCKTIGLFPKVTLPYGNNITCAISPNQVNSNMNKGCAEPITQKIKDYYIYLAVGSGIIVLSEIITLVLVIRLLQAIKKHRDYDNELQRMFLDD